MDAAVLAAGMPLKYEKELPVLVFDRCFNASRQALTENPPTLVEHMRAKLKAGPDLVPVEETPRVYYPQV